MTQKAKKTSTLFIIGLLMLFAGIGMFIFGASMFTYRGSSLSPFVSELGECSFFCWLPIMVTGGVLLIINHFIRRK